ncbi:MAG: MFS transporter [Candidatus Sigynarchaeota archaeon]
MYRSDIDEPQEWEKEDPQKRIGYRIKDALSRAFLRDIRFNKVQIAKTGLRSLILTALVIFWANGLFQRTPFGRNISDAWTWAISITGGATILFTGMVTDSLIERHGIFEKVSIIAIAPMSILLTVNDNVIVIIATLVLTVITAFLIVFFVVGLVINTTMLTRARVIVFMIIVMATFAAPVASLIVITETFVVTYLCAIIFTVISFFFSRKNPRRFTPTFNPIIRLPGFRGFLRVIQSSHAFRTAFFLFCTAIPLAYHATATINGMRKAGDLGEWITLAVVMIASLPIIAAVIDNRGRKPLVYIMLLLLGIISSIYDQPGFNITPIIYIKIGVLSFSVILLVIITIVFAGDLSSSISRGRITSVMLFCVLVGSIIGFMSASWVDENAAGDPTILTTVANSTAMLNLIGIFVFITISEQLQPGTTRWRDYLVRLHVIMNNGLSLVFKEFKKRRDESSGETLEDLESGGLTGLQQMLQEISNSRKRIRVLDHGDIFLIFHYGRVSTAVLFVEKNLVIYREKLANFHLQLEYINKDVIQENFINQEELQHVDWLIEHYFS